MKKLMALMALMTLTACDVVERADQRAERDDRLYRAAMDDYRSGRMDAAVAGFEKCVRKDPSNASARFQLACLMHDVKKDYLAAYCGYCEYLLQQPGSDKAKLALDRRAICEKELAKVLATKYGLNAVAAATAEIEALRKELRAARLRIAAAEKNLGESQARVRSLSAERERLLGVVKGFGSDSDEKPGVRQARVKEAKDLLEESDDDVAAPSVPAAEVAELREEGDEDSAQSSLLPVRRPNETPAKDAERKQDAVPVSVPERPKTYTVEDGDTLYGISKRFYGSVSAWKKIRDANKARVSTDGRLKVGDELVLP